MATAKERKQRIREASRQAVVKRRTSRVTTWIDPKVKKKDGTKHTSYAPELRVPLGLSPEARFMELRPKGYSPLEWMSFFTNDEGLWPIMVEEALFDLLYKGGDDK